MDLADVAAELYALLPAEFTAARNRRAKDAKTEGHPLLAKQVARLPKPTASAWAVNLIARQHPEELAPVLDLGAAMRDAQEMLDAGRLRALGQQRSQVLAAAVRRARSAAEALGVTISDAAAGEIEQTLRAAMGDPDAAAAVRSGLLVRPFAGGGFGPADLSGAVAVPGALADGGTRAAVETVDTGTRTTARAARATAATSETATSETATSETATSKTEGKKPDSTAVDAETERADRDMAAKDRAKAEAEEVKRLEAEEAEARREAQRQAEEARRREREEAQADLAEAEEALAAAEAELEDAERQAEEATSRRESLEGELAGLRTRVAELEEDLDGAEREEGLAGRARRLAARLAEQERRAVARARERLDRLT
ncbi:hypothetical protein [Sinomonas mesophila]|uniref:hypothetical protein n=1 Tax=Sinomonas mesophila TaxID=1531955 RepID=UPI000984AE3A|nr:hypothetical protein [Sinomonas mesophila]